MSDDAADVVLQLTKVEALVLFELVSRFSKTDVLKTQDRAEAQVLWNVCCLLEEQLTEPFDPDFPEILQAARERLRPLDTDD